MKKQLFDSIIDEKTKHTENLERIQEKIKNEYQEKPAQTAKELPMPQKATWRARKILVAAVALLLLGSVLLIPAMMQKGSGAPEIIPIGSSQTGSSKDTGSSKEDDKPKPGDLPSSVDESGSSGEIGETSFKPSNDQPAAPGGESKWLDNPSESVSDSDPGDFFEHNILLGMNMNEVKYVCTKNNIDYFGMTNYCFLATDGKTGVLAWYGQPFQKITDVQYAACRVLTMDDYDNIEFKMTVDEIMTSFGCPIAFGNKLDVLTRLVYAMEDGKYIALDFCFATKDGVVYGPYCNCKAIFDTLEEAQAKYEDDTFWELTAALGWDVESLTEELRSLYK